MSDEGNFHDSLKEPLIEEVRPMAKSKGYALPLKPLFDQEKLFFDGTGNGLETEWYKMSILGDTLILTLNSIDPSLKTINDCVLDVGIKNAQNSLHPNHRKISTGGSMKMADDIQNALQSLDKEINKSLRECKWPEYCGMVGDAQPTIQVDESIQSVMDPNKVSIFDIKLLNTELSNANSIISYIKEEMKNQIIKPLNGNTIGWMSFDKLSGSSEKYWVSGINENPNLILIRFSIFYR